MSQIQHESNAVTSVMMREAAYKRMLMDKGMVVLGHCTDWNSRTGLRQLPRLESEKAGLRPSEREQRGSGRLVSAPPLETVSRDGRRTHPPEQSNIPHAHATSHVRPARSQHDSPPSEAPQPPARAHTTPLIVVKEEPRETNLPLDASHVEYCQPMTKMTQRLLDSIMENAYIKFTIDTSERIPPNGSAGASRVAQRAARYEPYLAARRTKLYREQMARGRDAPPPAHADDPAGGFLQPQPTSALRSRLLSVDPPSSPCSLAPNSCPSTACSTPPPVTPPPACHPSLALQAQHVASPPSRASLSTVTGHPCAPSNPSQLHELHWVPCIVSPDGALRRVHNLRRLAGQSPHEHLAQFQPMENPNSLTAADQPPGNASYVRLVQQPMCKPRPPAPAHHPGLAVRQDYVSREQFVRPVAQQSLARSPQVSMNSNPNPGQPPPQQPSPPNDRPSRSRKRPRRPNYPRLPRRRLPGLPGELVIIQEYPCSTDNIPCQPSTSSRAVVHPRPAPASKSSM